MRAVIQRVTAAEVTVRGASAAETLKGKIGKGIVVLLGIAKGDSEKDIQWMVEKIPNLRIFEGEDGKLDLSLRDVHGEILLVSQFTLYGKCDKGRRPDFGEAAPIEEAKETYKKAAEAFLTSGIPVQEGEFQAYMQVKLQNDGPLTLILESQQQF